MLTHFESPILDSLYDVCLISWNEALEPPLPSHNSPAAEGGLSTFANPTFHTLFDNKGYINFPSSSSAQGLKEVVEDRNSTRLPLHAPKDPHYDPTITAEITRIQSILFPHAGNSRMALVTDQLNLGTDQVRKGTAPECSPEDEMTPYIPHPVHELFPIALVNRKPWGATNHACVNTPQNEAWLSAIRNATQTVFIQTPDLNAEPLLPELISAVKRSINVPYYVCLGYNDAGELLPYQGRTNEMIAAQLYSELKPEEKKNLHVGYYLGKDQTMPIHNKFKSRSCHVKITILDSHIGIQGNGNQDIQSWYHSQEVNIMIDSENVCKAWLEGIRRNENTHQYGMASQEDGVWRGKDGKEAEGAIGKDPGHFNWAKGITGAINRVGGAGGF